MKRRRSRKLEAKRQGGATTVVSWQSASQRRPAGRVLARSTDDLMMAMDYYVNFRGKYGYAKTLIERWDRKDSPVNVRVICTRWKDRCLPLMRTMSREKWRGLIAMHRARVLKNRFGLERDKYL